MSDDNEAVEDRKSIWVVAKNRGHDGYSAPLHAFLTQKEATPIYGLLSKIDISFELFEVPLGLVQFRDWWNIKPVKKSP